MESKIDLKESIEGLHKSAIIYRDDSATFIYVCFHCGRMFNEINETLQHIESHFQLTNVLTKQFITDDGKDYHLDETVDIKVEILDNKDETMFSDKREFRCNVCGVVQLSRFSLRVHALNDHIHEPMECRYCNCCSFKGVADFETHLTSHMEKGEVDWKNLTEGIQSGTAVDWSVFDADEATEADLKLLVQNEVAEVVTKTNPSFKKTSTAKNRRKRQYKPREYSRPYQCHKCSQKFRYTTALRSHFETHTNDCLLEVCRCTECDGYYKNSFALRLHVLEHHQNIQTFSCKACASEFTNSQTKQFEEHLQDHNGPDKKLWPDIRDGIYQQNENCTKYEEFYSFIDEQFSCEFCTQRFHLKCNLDGHMKSIHSGQRRLQCGQCHSIFTTPKYYFAHQLEHQRVGQVIVERDDNVLLANLDACIDERIVYEENESKEQLYRCLICNTAFEVHYDIRAHIRERHVYKMFPPPMEPKKEFICDLCGMRMKSKAALKNHLLIHTNSKPHPCTICGKTFRQNSDRKIHERQHTGEKPYQCHECGKAFISRGLLTAHKKSHEDTTYPCEICGRSFNLPSGYRKHIQTHRQDRSFKCPICPKSFNTRIYLGKHMSIHSDKQYQCRFCECKFNTSDGQRQHQRHKHHYSAS